MSYWEVTAGTPRACLREGPVCYICKLMAWPVHSVVKGQLYIVDVCVGWGAHENTGRGIGKTAEQRLKVD